MNEPGPAGPWPPGAGGLRSLWSPLGRALALIVQPLGLLAEFVLMRWLTVKGIDAARWRKRALASRTA